jgi:acetolactate synthase-1/2/3 large subunit
MPVEIAEQLAGALRAAGTDLLFGVPGGGANLDMVGAAQAAGCRFILTHTETAATIMAGVTAELTGQPSASVVTRGPGAASAVNGAAQTLLDRQPVVVIADCVTIADWDRVSHQRLDQTAMLGATTKASVRLGPHDTAATASAVVAYAMHGRPGPVHVDVDPTAGPAALPTAAAGPPQPDGAALDAARAALRAAHRPVVIAGVGVVATSRHRRSAAVAALRRFAEKAALPVLTTYKGRGLVADSATYAAGVATGATIEAAVLDHADLIVGIGLDPVELIPGPWPYQSPMVLVGGWAVDDSTFFGDRLVAEVVGDLAAVLDDLAGDVRSDWEPAAGARHRQSSRRRLLDAVPSSPEGLTPQQVVTVARQVAPKGTIATVDAGAHMLVAMPLWEVDEPGELLVSSGLATMGFALPAATAAALVYPGRRVVCFTGDGGLAMALAELETLARLRLRVVVVVFNDATLSLIAVKQRAEGHGGTGAVRYAPIDFAATGKACGMWAQRVDHVTSYRQSLNQALALDGPTLLDVKVDPSAYPAVIAAIRGRRPPATSE